MPLQENLVKNIFRNKHQGEYETRWSDRSDGQAIVFAFDANASVTSTL